MAFRKSSKVPATWQPKDVYATITNQIVKLLEDGVRPWARSWGGSDFFARPVNHAGKPYQGVNVLMLWATAQINGWQNPTWMTYNQAKKLGGYVRKGEHSHADVVFFERRAANPTETVVTTKGKTENDEPKRKDYFILKSYAVFNVEQIDGLPDSYKLAEPVAEVAKKERIPHAEAFFDALPINIKHGGSRAFYMPSQHRVQMPEFDTFFTAEAYYATRMHESVHWTKHSSVLDREVEKSERWGDEGYAIEELVAEIGAAFGMADLGLVNHPREDHASYIAHWIKVLKNDKKAIFTAARFAETAVKKLHDLAGENNFVPVPVEDAEAAVFEMAA